MTFLAPLVSKRVSHCGRRASTTLRAARDAASNALGVLAAATGVAGGAGDARRNDNARQRRYEREVRAHQQRLRDWFYPRVQREIATPTPRPPEQLCAPELQRIRADSGVRGAGRTAAARVRAVLPSIAWLLALAAALSALAVRRLGALAGRFCRLPRSRT